LELRGGEEIAHAHTGAKEREREGVRERKCVGMYVKTI